MKKSLIFLSFLVFFNGSFFNPTLDTENIKLDLKRLDNEKILIEWSVDFDFYDDIVLQISHDNNLETIQLDSPDGQLELCCYPDYVRVTVSVFVTDFEDITGPDCPAEQCKKIIEMEGLDLRYYKVIYDLVDDIKAALSGMLSPEIREEIVGIAEVRDVFQSKKYGDIVCKCTGAPTDPCVRHAIKIYLFYH